MVKLKLNGKVFEKHLSPLTIKVKAFLDKSPDDEIFTIQEMALRARVVDPTSVRCANFYNSPTLKDYNVKANTNRYWGNPKAIAELMRQIENESK